MEIRQYGEQKRLCGGETMEMESRKDHVVERLYGKKTVWKKTVWKEDCIEGS